MTDLEDIRKNVQLLKSFELSLEKKDFSKARECLKLVDTTEESFLNTYNRRKNEGVNYTSEEISRFMISQALTLYLSNKLSIDEKSLAFSTIEDLVKLDQGMKGIVLEILMNTTICDPACGSGIFLLNAADMVYKFIKKLDPLIDEPNVKRKIVNNIYGFDINEHSVQLSILKLISWMGMAEDDDIMRLVTSLKQKIRAKNSLFMENHPKFDIIVGNPPYGNILSKEEKELLKNENVFHNDIYCAFIFKLIDWSEGILSLLIPKSFLLRQGYVKFRNNFLSKVNLLKIFDIGPNLFKKATNEVQIILYEKKSSVKNVEILDYPDKNVITYPNQLFDTLRACYNFECSICDKSKKVYAYTFSNRCPYCNAETVGLNRIRIKPSLEEYNLINKIEKIGDLNYLNVNEFPKMVRGEEDKGLKEVKRILRNDLDGSCLFINAKEDFKQYFLKKTKSFNIEEINAKLLKGNNYEFYTSPKLLIKHNNIIPEAIFTKETACFTSSIYSLLYEDITELKFLCAVLNSALMKFYCTYGINNQKGTTINLNQYMVRHLPIMGTDKHFKDEIALKVDKIIDSLQENEGTLKDFIKHEINEIDDIVFNLYAFSQKECEIVRAFARRG